MKYLEVTEFDPGVGKEYNAPDYPKDGVYHNPRLNNVFCRLTCPGALSPSIFVMYAAALIKETAAVPEQRQGISEDTLLRALAICQTPSIASQLLGIRPA